MPNVYPPYIFGMHDRGGEHLLLAKARPGWVLVTEGIGSDPYNFGGSDYTDLAYKGLGVMVRLNYGYEGAGTIPHSSLYDDFARRCGNFVERSLGCHVWIIGNEMNLPYERPGNANGVGGEVITPQLYARCYEKCRTEIRRRASHAEDQVVVGAVGPWNMQTTYAGNKNGDFRKYLADILANLTSVDGISLHTYTHGTDPGLITAETRMKAPYAHLHNDFRVYQDFMAAIPERFRDRPVYITETDQYDEWLNADNGWVQTAYREINDWNRDTAHQPIQALILFRWTGSQAGNQRERGWAIENKSGVQGGLRAAMEHDYRLVAPRAIPDYRAAWLEAAVPTRMDPGVEVSLAVTIRNDGRVTWPHTSGGGSQVVQVGQRWIDAAGRQTEGPRMSLPHSVPPGSTIQLPAVKVRPPAAPGYYTLELDLVVGSGTWFASLGSPAQRVPGIQVGKRYLAAWLGVVVPSTASAGESVTVPVRLRNDGVLTWTPSGTDPFNLSYQWLDAARRVIVPNGRRTVLGRDVPPGGEISLDALIQMPAQAGRFILQLDMVHEHVTWFHDKASLPSETWVDVQPARPDYAAQWLGYTGPRRLAPGEATTAVVRVRNTGAQPWPASGSLAVSLGHRWLDQQGQVVAYNKASQALSQAVGSDATATFDTAAIASVQTPGTYRLVWDLVQGGNWLSARGEGVLEVVVQVEAPAYGVTWQVVQPWPTWLLPASTQRTRLRLTNSGTLAWPAGGDWPVHLAYHWFGTGGARGVVEPWDTFRLLLPADVSPGAAVEVDVDFATPGVPGRYTLRWDLVHEGVAWFFRQGAAPLEVPVEVTDQAVYVSWSGQASDNTAAVALALDGQPTTWWDSQVSQRPGMWFQVDLGEVRHVSRCKAVSPGRGFPVAYRVLISEDGQNWRQVAAADKNWRDVDVAWAPARARYLRLEQTGTPDYATTWAITDVAVASAAPWGGATASHNAAGVGLAIDGRLDTAWNTVAKQQSGMWYQVDLGTARRIERIVLVHPKNQQPRGYVVRVSNDGQTWQEVGRKDDNWGLVDVSFEPVDATFVRVETTNSSPYHPWGIAELIVWESAPTWLRGTLRP